MIKYILNKSQSGKFTKKNVCLNISENKKSNNIRMSNLAKHKRRFLYKKKKNREHYSTDRRGAALRYYFFFFEKLS